jgi:hypothetical protein
VPNYEARKETKEMIGSADSDISIFAGGDKPVLAAPRGAWGSVSAWERAEPDAEVSPDPTPAVEELKAAHKEHEAMLAKLALIQKERNTSMQPPATRNLERANKGGDMASPTGDPSRRRGQLPPYAFKGTIARFLQPILTDHLVLIYGGSRADLLENGMRDVGIDARRETYKPNKPHTIPTTGRTTGLPLAIVDVSEGRSPEEVREWLCDISDALPVGGFFATLSRDLNQLEVLGMLGENYGWRSDATEGSGSDYWILVLQKGPHSDELLRAELDMDLRELR